MEKVIKNLERKGIKVTVFDTAKEAADYLCREIHNTTVGIGGSMTVRDMGLYERLCDNNSVSWHLTDEERAREIIERAAEAKVYISGANAIAEEGAIVNLDGCGNRVAATLYGHKKVYIISSTSKIVPTLEDAIWRTRNVAAPLNARRLNKKTPCAVGELKCHNCASGDCICNGFSVLIGKMGSTEHMELVMIKEKLGF